MYMMDGWQDSRAEHASQQSPARGGVEEEDACNISAENLKPGAETRLPLPFREAGSTM